MDTLTTERHSYLDAPYGLAAWLLTRDHKRIAVLYMISIAIMFTLGAIFAAGVRTELLTPQGDFLSADLYNKFFTMHGVIMVFFFLVPSIPATLGNFLMPIMCGTKDLAFPADQPAELVSLRDRRAHRARRRGERRARHGLDVLHALQQPQHQHQRDARDPRRLRGRLLIDPDGLQLHRDGPPDARAGADLVPPAPLRVGALRDEPRHDPGHAGRRHHPDPRRGRTLAAPRHLRPADRRRPGADAAPVLVLLAPGRLHHDPAGHGRRQRAGRRHVAQADLRLRVRRFLEPGDRRHRLPRLGPPPVREQPVDLRGPGVLRSSACSSPCRRP